MMHGSVAGQSQSPTDGPAWQALAQHYQEIRGRHLRQFFAADPARGERLTAEAVGIYLDYSKNRIDDKTMRLLVAVAEERGLRGRITAMFTGEKINVTERRAVLHTLCVLHSGSRSMVRYRG
jgi:glucose-6-phosphate isomerase